jgi:tRNA nucleotidyltransferase/poly(A) polymerase
LKALILFFYLFLFVATPELSEVRKQYTNAIDSKANAEKFYKLLERVSTGDSKTLVAYKGASIALQAKFSPKKEDKKKQFVEGTQLLEFALKNDPKNLEIRLIRLSIQENTPKIMKYKANIAEDKQFIVSNFAKQNNSIKEFVKLYLKQSKVFSAEEKAAMQ